MCFQNKTEEEKEDGLLYVAEVLLVGVNGDELRISRCQRSSEKNSE